jgi:arginase family enzyme
LLRHFHLLVHLTDHTLQRRPGVDRGPIHLVEAGLVEQLTELGWKVKFDGHHQFEEINAETDPPIGKLCNPRLVSKVCESVAKVVGEHVKNGELPVTLGGDHSLVSTFWVYIVFMALMRSLSDCQAMGTISGTLEYVGVLLRLTL